MKIEFLAAEAELEEAVDYYNGQSEGLGFAFLGEIRDALGRILQFPDAWHPLSKRTRRCRTKRFSYGVIYQNRNDLILIVSIMHLRCQPDSWKNRLKKREQ